MDNTPVIIFITARFRSGSTMLWNLLRKIPRVRGFYEPLHEQLPSFIRYPIHPAKDHLFVESYFDEYNEAQKAVSLHKSSFATSRLYLEKDDEFPELRDYIQALIDSIPEGHIGVFKFNRIDLRLAWIRKNFPSAFILHLTRNPRTEWYSSLSKYEGDIDHDIEFDDYFISTWARDLYPKFPFLATPQISHAYQRFYYLWKLSNLAGSRGADLTVSYENLLNMSEETLSTILDSIGLLSEENLAFSKQYIVSNPKRTWVFNQSENWFVEHEQKCENILEKLQLNADFYSKPLSQIQKNSVEYKVLLKDLRNKLWAKECFQQEISKLRCRYYERDYILSHTIWDRDAQILGALAEIERLRECENQVRDLSTINDRLEAEKIFLSSELLRVKEEINRLQLINSDNEQRKQDLQSNNDYLQFITSSLSSELSEVRSRIKQMEQIKQEIELECTKAKEELANTNLELTKVKEENLGLYNSRSYRITSPLRAIFGLVRKLRDKITQY